MDRRAFLKLSAAAASVAAMSYYGTDVLKVTNASLKSTSAQTLATLNSNSTMASSASVASATGAASAARAAAPTAVLASFTESTAQPIKAAFSTTSTASRMSSLSTLISTSQASSSSSSTTTTTTTTTTSAAPVPAEAMPAALQIPHLLRRAGFGATPDELAQFQAMDFDDAVDYLLNYDQLTPSDTSTPNVRTSYSGQVPAGQNELNNLATWWLNRMVVTNRPLEEKMTLFWHNHFATGFFKVQNGYLMYQQNQFLRTNALGNFHDMLTGITSDGAMLIWLDGNQNRKNNPNENYAREVMEVFSTGRGPYTQDDVTNGAKAFTGYYINSEGVGVFNPAQHDDSVKTFLGQTGNFGPADIINILVARPETAANISTELFEFFAYPNPSQDVVQRLADVYTSSGYNIKSVVEAILKSPEFVSTQAYLANVKSPVEYITTALHSLGTSATVGSELTTMNNQGQFLFNPPSVFGWPSGTGWINTGVMMERFNFPIGIQTARENPSSSLDPTSITGTGTQEDKDVSDLLARLFPDGLPQEVVQVIQASTVNISNPEMRVKNVVRLAMASPFYNLN